MLRQTQRSGRPSKIALTAELVSFFAAMTTVFYDDALAVNSYCGFDGPFLPHCGGRQVSQVKLNR